MISFFKNLPEGKKQAIKFIIIGISAVLTDMFFYYIFLQFFPENWNYLSNETISKGLSFLCGFFVTYNFNSKWTWRQQDHSKSKFYKFIVLYSLSLLINVSLNSLTLYVLQNMQLLQSVPNRYFIAFISATGFSSVFNFLGQKFWVFKDE
jgi:putative flippase GtrA